MNTIAHFYNAARGFNLISSTVTALAAEFEQVAPITDLDKAQIDVMIASAQNMIVAAEALKSVAYNPTPEVLPG